MLVHKRLLLAAVTSLALTLASLPTTGGTGLARETVSLIGPFSMWGETLQEALARFSERHGVQAELIDVAQGGWPGVRERVATLTAAGVAPDLLYGDNWTLDYYALNGLSQPIDALAQRDLDMSVYPAGVIEAAYVHHGRLWALPTALSVLNLYYNVDAVESRGLADPPADWAADGFTWDDFVEMAVKLTQDANGDGTPDRFGTSNWGWAGGISMIGLWGLHMMDRDGTEWYGDDAGVVEVLDRFATLWTEHNVVGGNFRAGTAAMVTDASGALNANFAIDAFRWNAAALPKGSQRASETGFHGIGLSQGTRNPELAWKLLKYLAYEPEGSVLFALAENRVPVLRDALAEVTERWRGRMPESGIRAVIGATAYVYDTHFSRHPRGPAELVPLIFQAGERITSGAVSARQAMDELAPLARAILADR